MSEPTCTCEVSLCSDECVLCASLPRDRDCPGPSSVDLLDLLDER